MTNVTLNLDQRLFVLKEGAGFTCLGFDVAFKRLKQFAAFLGRPAPAASDIGTLKQYKEYREAERDYIATNPQRTHFDPDTDPLVQQVLEDCRTKKRRVRIFLGNTESGECWMEEFDVVGRIGRSTGPLKVPLLVEAGESGGGAILTACILRIMDTRTQSDLYRHAKYQVPEFDIRQAPQAKRVEVLCKGEVHARFDSKQDAENWCAFMRGERMST